MNDQRAGAGEAQPCPECTSDNLQFDAITPWMYILCCTCGFCITRRYTISNEASTKAILFASWNRRAPDKREGEGDRAIPDRLMHLYRNDVAVAQPMRDYIAGRPLTDALVDAILHMASMRDRCIEALKNRPPMVLVPKPAGEDAPISMILPCPRCRLLHVDAPEPEKGWTNPPHKSHLCHYCGLVWRPADVPTNGVASIATIGKDDNWKPGEQPAGEAGGWEWSKTPPRYPGLYWHWTGDPDAAPLPYTVFCREVGSCFITRGQYGIDRARECRDEPGWWLRLALPRTPPADPNVEWRSE